MGESLFPDAENTKGCIKLSVYVLNNRQKPWQQYCTVAYSDVPFIGLQRYFAWTTKLSAAFSVSEKWK